jgi:acetolactate synthase-1/2/3 large subunit
MGFGLPAAMGVKLAFPKVIMLLHNRWWSIQMNIQEFLQLVYSTTYLYIIISLNNRLF